MRVLDSPSFFTIVFDGAVGPFGIATTGAAVEHFCLKLRKRKYALKMNREEFAPISVKPSFGEPFSYLVEKGAYVDSSGSEYKMEWCEEYRKLCLDNYDRNMMYFDRLDEASFNEALDSFLQWHKGFSAVDDLRRYSGVSGYYMMILDEYKQAYIGKSIDITKRIKQHWTATKPLDRTLLPMYNDNSCFSIDFFRALDTTRVYVWERGLAEGVEKELVGDFPQMYLTNRIGGDVMTGIEALATMNARAFRQ